jgi:lysophospholipase L1-like esterase
LLLANDSAWNTGVIYRSTDGGASWAAVASKGNVGQESDAAQKKIFQIETATAAGLGLTRLVFDPKDANTAYGFNSEFILKTTDGGRTWFDTTAERVGDGWRGRGYAGWVSTNFLFNPYKPGHAVLQAMDMGRAWISRDGMKSWKYTLSEPWPWGGGRDASITRSGRLYVTTGQHGAFQGIARSDDGGEKWQVFHGDKHGLPPAGWGHGQNEPAGIYALPDEPDRVWAVVARKLLKSTDGGKSWSEVGINDKVEWIAADPKKPGRFFVSGDKNVYATTDGATFEPIGGPHRAGKMTVDTLGRLYIAAEEAGRAGLWRWDGKAWARLWDEYRVHDVAVDPRDPQRIAVATNQNPYTEDSGASGVYISSDGGASWAQQNQGLAMLRGYTIKFNPHDSEQLVFGSNGRGFFHTRWPRAFKPAGTRRFTQTDEDVRYAQVDTSVIEKPDAANLARNPSMTGGADTPEGWADKFGDVTAARDTQTFKSAPAALRVEAPAGKEGAAFQVLEGTGGKTLRLSGFFKTSGGGGAQVMAQSFDGGWTKNEFKQIKYLQGEFDWQPFEATIAVPDWAARTHIGILAKDGSRAFLDDVTVTFAEGASTSAAAGGVAVTNVISDFGNFNYTYGPDWKLNENVKGGDAAGASFVRIDATEHGGAGLVLNGANIAPQKQTHLAIRARRMPGNKAAALAVNLNRADADGGGKGVTFDLSKLSEIEWTTLTVPLPEGNWSKVQQIQLQGTNWSAAAQPLKIQIDSIGTTSVDEKANAAALAAAASDPTKAPPAKDKPAVAGHGFWPDFPAAWMQTFRGQLDRTARGKEGAEKINALFIGDSITQGWGDDNGGKALWQKYYAPRGVENFGIGGDTTRQVLYRLQNGLVDGLSPKVVVLRIGTNNLYNDHNAGSDEEIAAGVGEIVKLLRTKLPGAKILLLDVLPRQNEYFTGRTKAINTLISKLDDGQNVRFLAMSDAFQTAPGKVRPELYTGDQLHLSAAGYARWAELMQPLFDQLMK